MQEKNNGEPRKFLVYILIIILIALISILVCRLLNKRVYIDSTIPFFEKMEKIENQYDEKAEEFEKKFEEKSKEEEEKFERRKFNSLYENYEGFSSGFFVKDIVENAYKNNKKTNNRMITISYGKQEGTDLETLEIIRDSIDTFTEYKVSVEYDDEGYVNKVIIEN